MVLHKPGSVLLFCKSTAIIYLCDSSLNRYICLPASSGEPPSDACLFGHFSMQGLPITAVAIRYRALLPHVFTLTHQGGRLFSVALSIYKWLHLQSTR